jgi:hypothetical protein
MTLWLNKTDEQKRQIYPYARIAYFHFLEVISHADGEHLNHADGELLLSVAALGSEVGPQSAMLPAVRNAVQNISRIRRMWRLSKTVH